MEVEGWRHLSRRRLVRLGARAREGSTTARGFPDRSKLGEGA